MGCAVSAVYPSSGHSLSKTHVVRERFRYSSIDPLRSLRTAIEAVNPAIVIPCDDRAVRHLHELHAREVAQASSGTEVSRMIETSLGPPESYPIVCSRYDLLRIAREEGIRIPETRQVTSASGLRTDHSSLQLPWVLKADFSWGGHGVRIADDPGHAADCFRELSQPLGTARFIKRLIVDRDPYWLQTWLQHAKPAVIVQSHIQGHPANSAVVCWKGKVLAGIAVEVVNAQGAIGPANIVRLVDNPELLLPAERLARRLGLSGFFGFDFIIEQATGQAFLIEMNPRCTPLSHLQLGKGRDLMGALSAQLSGTPLQERAPVTESDTIAYFPQALLWDPKGHFLRSSFQDVPSEEPDLVEELHRLPWPDRSVLARISNVLRRTTFRHRAMRQGVFESASAWPSAIVPLRTPGTKPPLFLIHGVDGTLAPFQALVRRLEADQPVYGIQSQALLDETVVLTSVEELAAYYIQAIQVVQARGPYNFLGFSFGGLIAFEMARQLQDRGERVGMLGLLDNLRMGRHAEAHGLAFQGAGRRLKNFAATFVTPFLSSGGLIRLREALAARTLNTIYGVLRARRRSIPRFLRRSLHINWFIGRNYVPRSYPGSVTLFTAAASTNDPGASNEFWAGLAGGGIEPHDIPGSHEDVLKEPNVIALAQAITGCLAEVQRATTPAPAASMPPGTASAAHNERDGSVSNRRAAM